MENIIKGSNSHVSFGNVIQFCTEWHNCTEERYIFQCKYILLQSELTTQILQLVPEGNSLWPQIQKSASKQLNCTIRRVKFRMDITAISNTSSDITLETKH